MIRTPLSPTSHGQGHSGSDSKVMLPLAMMGIPAASSWGRGSSLPQGFSPVSEWRQCLRLPLGTTGVFTSVWCVGRSGPAHFPALRWASLEISIGYPLISNRTSEALDWTTCRQNLPSRYGGRHLWTCRSRIHGLGLNLQSLLTTLAVKCPEAPQPSEPSKGGMKVGRIKNPLYKDSYFGITPPTFIPPIEAPWNPKSWKPETPVKPPPPKRQSPKKWQSPEALQGPKENGGFRK